MKCRYVECEILLYVNGTCSIFQHEDITEINTALNKNFVMFCDCFVYNKLSIHLVRIKKVNSVLQQT